MNGNARVSQYIYIRAGSTVVKALACYDRGSWFEPSNRQGFSSLSFYSLFLISKQTCKLEFTGFMLKSCLVETLPLYSCKCFIT